MSIVGLGRNMEPGQENCTEERKDRRHRQSRNSLFMQKPSECSYQIQRPSPPKTKKKPASKMALIQKSKAKQVVADDSGKCIIRRKRRTTTEDLYTNDDARLSVIKRTEKFLANLATKSPRIVKRMLPSNVARGFWMILPKKFCNKHFPMRDSTVILVDEFGEEYKTTYLVNRHGLSAGWRRFSIDHRLRKGDCVVFSLIGPCKLKVDIVRVYSLEEVDAALCLMSIVSGAKRTHSPDKNTRTRKRAKKCSAEPFLLKEAQENIQINNPVISNSKLGDEIQSEVSEGSEVSGHLHDNKLCSARYSFPSDRHFKDINCGFTAERVS